MSKITVKDGTEIYYKDWGTGQPIVFHHGLSGDDWDGQMMFFLDKGFRVIAHDRRGHGRSSQTANGHEMDTYAADVAELVKALDLKDAIHVGHSTGGGEVIRYVAKHGKGRVAKAVLISAVTPIMVQTKDNPQGIPLSVFDEIREELQQSVRILPGFYHAILWLQSRRRKNIARCPRQLVAPGDDGRHKSTRGLRQSFFRN